MQLAKLTDFEVIADVWPRRELDVNRVREFISLYEDGGLEALPPLMVVTTADTPVLYEGRHRYEALMALGAPEALVQAVPLPDGRELIEFAYEGALEASAVAALPLNRVEKRSAVLRLLTTRTDYSDREIARLTGLSHQTVGRIRTRSNGTAADDPSQDTATVYYAEVTADEIASRLVRGMRQMWDKRGLGDRIVGDRAGKRLAAALRDAHGDDALAWAERFTAWGRVAVSELKRAAA